MIAWCVINIRRVCLFDWIHAKTLGFVAYGLFNLYWLLGIYSPRNTIIGNTVLTLNIETCVYNFSNNNYSAILPSLYVLTLPNTHTIQHNIKQIIHFLLPLLIFEPQYIYNSPSKTRQFYRCSSVYDHLTTGQTIKYHKCNCVKIFRGLFRF